MQTSVLPLLPLKVPTWLAEHSAYPPIAEWAEIGVKRRAISEVVTKRENLLVALI